MRLAARPSSSTLDHHRPWCDQLYFVRHGESMWNVTFNRSKLLFIPRLAYSCLFEIYLAITTGDSWFYDSPLW